MPGGFDTPFEQTRVRLQQEEEKQAQDPVIKVTQDTARREFLKRKKAVKKKATKYLEKKVAKKLATRAILRVVGAVCASTLIFIVLTYLIWTIQAFAGNLMGSKWIPELELWELILWGLLGIILFAALIILIFIGIVAIAFSNPLILGTVLVKSLIGV